MSATAAEGTLARTWHGLTAAVVVAGVALAIGLGGPHSAGDIAAFPWPPARAANVLVYFTIQSNLIVGITALMLACPRAGRRLRARADTLCRARAGGRCSSGSSASTASP